jgi:hypothetical protein
MSMKKVRNRYLELRDKLLRFEGVLGVGFGEAEKKGKLTGEPAIVVLVEKKLPRSEVRKGEMVAASYKGVRIDVREPRLTRQQHRDFVKRNNLSRMDAESNMDLFWLDDGKLHQMYKKRRKKKKKKTEPGEEPADAPTTAVHGEIFVIEDKDCDSVVNADGTVDHVEAYKLFRTEFGDHYDFAFFRYDAASGVTQSGNSSPTIYNQISGINHYVGDSYDARASYGTSKLQSLQKMSWLGEVRTCLHETGHRWLAFAYHQEGGVHSENLHEEFSIPSQQGYHWGTWFDNDRSCMDYDYDDWVDSSIVPGEWEIDNLATGPPGVDEFGFHPLDLYLMGLIDPGEVGNFSYIQNPSDPDGNGSYSGTEVTLNVNNVIDEEGARNPAYPNTQRVYHQAYILITKDMSGIGTLGDSTTILGELELYRGGMVEAFRRETWSRGMVDGSLLHDNFEDIYVRDNAADTGGSSSTGAFWDSPDIWVRNANDGSTDHQDTLREQDNYVNVRVWNDSGSEYEDVIVRAYRANYAGTEFFYPDDWYPDNLIGEQVITVPNGSSATAVITWDEAFIPDASWHPCLLVEVIPMEVTPEGRQHVWENRKLAQKNITISDPSEEEPEEIAFRFGHVTRKRDRYAILTVARTVNLPGMELFLDPDGMELGIEENAKLLPGREYLTPSVWTKPAAGHACTCPTHLPCPGGLSLTFPRDTEILLGSGCCTTRDPCSLAVTVCRGSRFVIHGPTRIDTSAGKLVRVYKDGRMLYRLPDQDILGLKVPITGRGIVEMKLHLDLANTPQHARGGLVQLIQSGRKGEVMGGIVVLVRP